MLEFPTVWEQDCPDSLFNLSIKSCVQNPHTFCNLNPLTSECKLREGLSLPEEICEQMLDLFTVDLSSEQRENLFRLFEDNKRTRLRRVNLNNSLITDDGMEIICRHNISELNIANCPKLSEKSLTMINSLNSSLLSLVVGNSVQIFSQNENSTTSNSSIPEGDNDVSMDVSSTLIEQSEAFILNAPQLQKLAVEGLFMQEQYFKNMLSNLQFLMYLDLSKCKDVGDLSYLQNHKHLTSLVLYNVWHVQRCVVSIGRIKSLRHLDLSYSGKRYAHYSSPNKTLRYIVESLKNLVSLDISGTNLAGNRIQERMETLSDDKNAKLGEEIVKTDIPGLKSRVSRPLKFLGLFNTKYDACHRHHIPAERISGDANEEQILTAAQLYCGRSEMIQKVLNNINHMFCFLLHNNNKLALDVVVEAMRLHPKKKSVQISGSASLLYILKTERKDHFSIKAKKKIIKVLLDAMFVHITDMTLLKIGCLILANFKMPDDVLPDYERLTNLLLSIIARNNQDEYVQRIGFYLFRKLTKVDCVRKQFVGSCGAMTVMLQFVESRLYQQVYDSVMETAWSIMWNLTDETPLNCQLFLEGKGMIYFVHCCQVFPDKVMLLRKMIGLLGNVAEVKELRPCLMRNDYLLVFRDLLHHKSDNIEINYSAAGILSHIMSDGPDLWKGSGIMLIERQLLLHHMVETIESWDLDTKLYIKYRSLLPFLRLLLAEHTPEAQHWAVWVLANLTQVQPEKYCTILKEEGGIAMVEKLLNSSSYPRIYELASIVIHNCNWYERNQHLL